MEMKINHMLAVVPVADFTVAWEWSVRLISREPDNNP